MELTKRQQNALRDFLLNPVKLTYSPSIPLGQWLRNNYGDLLSWRNNQLIFDAQSKQNLKQAIHLHEPHIFHRSHDTQSRIGMAGISRQEKNAKLAPEDTHVLVNQHQGNYSCIGLNAELPAGVSLRVALNHLRNAEVSKIVVIENLDIFDNWHQANWGGRDECTLAVYRGHEKFQTRGVSRLLEIFASKARIIAFCDYDPKGAEIALTTQYVHSLLLPVLADIDQQLQYRINQPHLYQQQLRSVSFLRRNSVACAHHQLQALWNDSNLLAVLQQHMLAHHITLQEIVL